MTFSNSLVTQRKMAQRKMAQRKMAQSGLIVGITT